MKTTHFIGIGGIGMSGLARLLLAKNETVSGSDIRESEILRDLKMKGAQIYIGHDLKNVPEKARVVVSTDIKSCNPELKAVSNPIHRSDLLLELMTGHKSLLVAGTHGKTTTSSLLAHTLDSAGLNPSFVIGGILKNFGVNSALGSGEFFVAEADESDGTHVKYHPYGLIVTNIDNDHLNHYGTEAKLIEAFKALIYKVENYDLLFTCGDDPILKGLKLPGNHYGFDPSNNIQITYLKQRGLDQTFNLKINGVEYSEIYLPLIGRHNVLNAAAVFGLSLAIGISEKEIRKAFFDFKGVKRRADLKWEKKQVRVYDDYAHHPEEIKATIKAFQLAFPERRLVVVFQPHRYSRTKDCFNQFKEALKADVVIVTDLYAAGENPIDGISTESLIQTLDPKTIYIPRKELAEKLSQLIRPYDVVVTMGAGDITKLSDELNEFPIRALKMGLLFGGRSKEHEVSFTSAKNVYKAVDRNLFHIIPFAISKQGGWVTGDKARELLEEGTSFDTVSDHIDESTLQEFQKCDLVFPCLHGTNGEDGTVQGFLEIMRIGYVGCGVESSAIAMNKALTKRLCAFENIPMVPFVDFIHYEWQTEPEKWIQKIESKLCYPLFVKPVHLGSTVGVTKVHTRDELIHAIEKGFTLDTHLIVETGVQGREIEFSVMGAGPWMIFNPGEIVSSGAVYDYDAKYGPNSFKVLDEAPLTSEQKILGKKIALDAYKAIRADGMARVDLFLTNEGEFLLNEINPIPGFTQNSLFPRMCQAGGLSYPDLIAKLAEEGLSNELKKDRIH